MDDLSINISKRLVEMREAIGLSQSAVARKIGAVPCVVCRWENGTYCPSAFWLIRLADFYGCTVDEILGRAG